MRAAHRWQGVGYGLLVLLAGTAGALGETWRIQVKGTGADLGETPVVVALKKPIPPGVYDLKPPDQPVQVFNDQGKTYLATIFGRVAAKDSSAYTLRPSENTSAGGVVLERDGANVKILVGGKLFTEYVSDQATKPYYYPVIGPTGAAITRHYPMKKVEGEDQDHNHQRSLWFTYDKVNGAAFWASDPLNPPRPDHGTIKETSRTTLVSGPVLGRIRTTDDWLNHDGKRVMQDERVVTVYNTATAQVLDFDITLKATDGPVTFGDTKEGMFGLRVASSMDVMHKKAKGQGKITNAEGITDAAAWGKASPWVDYVGPVEGQTVGVAILNRPDSFRYPTTWHVRDYGLFAANPFGWHDFGMKTSGEYTLPAGQSIQFGYRVIFHKGDTAAANVARAFESFAKPPVIEVEGD